MELGPVCVPKLEMALLKKTVANIMRQSYWPFPTANTMNMTKKVTVFRLVLIQFFCQFNETKELYHRGLSTVVTRSKDQKGHN